jgi:hypothetical protein
MLVDAVQSVEKFMKIFSVKLNDKNFWAEFKSLLSAGWFLIRCIIIRNSLSWGEKKIFFHPQKSNTVYTGLKTVGEIIFNKKSGQGIKRRRDWSNRKIEERDNDIVASPDRLSGLKRQAAGIYLLN